MEITIEMTEVGFKDEWKLRYWWGSDVKTYITCKSLCSHFGVFQPFLFNAVIFPHHCSSSPGLRSLADCCRAPSVSWPYPIPLLLPKGGCPSGKPRKRCKEMGHFCCFFWAWFFTRWKGKGLTVNKIMFIQWNDEGTSFLPIVGWRCLLPDPSRVLCCQLLCLRNSLHQLGDWKLTTISSNV